MKTLVSLFALLFIPFDTFSQSFENISDAQGIDVVNYSAVFGSGISFYDYNNDGWDDLTFGLNGQPFKFYRNVNGNFIEETINGLSEFENGETKSVLWVDFDNDGDPDFFASYRDGPIRLFENDGSMNFTEVSASLGFSAEPAHHWGCSWADYDRDGDLDLYVVKNEAYGNVEEEPFLTNYLYRNDDSVFTEVSQMAGVCDSLGISFQSVFFDYDMDGWLDLYVANDKWFENGMYRNNGDGTFEDVGEETGMNMVIDAMCTAAGDFNNDGWIDMYITNTATAAGGIGNMIMKNNGGESFESLTLSANTQVQETCWGATWLDIDNDGWLDLYVAANGNAPNQPVNHLFRNNGDETFTQVNDQFGMEMDDATSYANCMGDINNDGYADIANNNRNPYTSDVWLNSGGDNRWLKISLEGTLSNRDGIGSTIRVYASNSTYTRQIYCGENYLSQNSQREIFGLGLALEADSISIDWPSGHRDVYYDVQSNETYHFVEGANFLETIEISFEGDLELCPGESVTLVAEAPANCVWNTGEEGPVITVSEAGFYSVSATNEFGMTVTSDTVEVLLAPEPQIDFTVVHISCTGQGDGSIAISVSTGPLESIIWNSGSEDTILTGLEDGIYSFEATDSFGCPVTGETSITEPAPLFAQAQPTDAKCFGTATGSIDFQTVGGTPPVTVDWMGQNPDSVAAGSYSAVLSDANGCAVNLNYSIDQPEDSLTLAFESTNAYGGNNNGTASLEVSGGTPPYTINWSTGDVDVTLLEGLAPGDYAVSVEDANSCKTLHEFEISSTLYVEDLPEPSPLIYPNPFQEELTIEFSTKGPFRVELFDALGRRVLDQQLQDQTRTTLSTTHLHSGSYILKMYYSSHMYAKLLMKK